MTGLFTREINVLNWLHRLQIFCYFLVRAENTDEFPRSRCRTPGSERRLPVNVLWASPKKKLGVDFGTRRQTLPTNPGFFFPPFKCVGSGSCWRSEEKEVKENGGKIWMGGQPQGRRKILYACALKHKVCGQLLKDFFFSSGVKIILIVRGGKGRVLYDSASVSQFYWVTERQTLSAQLCFWLFSSLRHSHDRDLLPPASPYAPHPPHLHPGLPRYHFPLENSFWMIFVFPPLHLSPQKWGEALITLSFCGLMGTLPRSRSSICTATLVKSLKGAEPLKHLLASSSILYVVKPLKAKQT